MLCNYHTHTTRCGHASGTDREYIETAIKAGYKVLGFSDHVPTPVYEPDFPQFRMPMSGAAEYAESLAKLRDEYKNDIEIHIGYECEYIPFLFDKHLKMLVDSGCEYLILGQHFIFSGNSENPYPMYGRTESKDTITMFTDVACEAMSTGRFSYICHPDIFRYEGDDRDFIAKEHTRLCECAKKYNVPLEFNMQGYVQHRHYPVDEFFMTAKEIGNDVIIGVDAHTPSFLADIDGFNSCVAHIDELGLNRIEKLSLKSLR